VFPHTIAISTQSAGRCSVGETPTDASEPVALPFLKGILMSQ
jgi:hypothetical protein